MDQISRGWLIYQVTGSPLQLGLATAMRGIPLLLFGVIAGGVADRYGRKRQLIISQVTNGFINLLLATLVLMHLVHPWHIYVTAFIAGTVQAFQQPARQTMVSDTVGKKHLINALALNSAALNSSRAIGPAVGGILIATVGVDGSYYAQAFLYFFATIWTIQMHVPERSPESFGRAREGFFTSIGSGIAYVAKTSNIRTIMILALGPVTFGMAYTSMMPIFAIKVLHGGSELQGFLLTAVGLGALAGALVVASMRRDNSYALPAVIGASMFCVALIGFSISHWIWLSVIFLTMVGIFNVTYLTQDQTLAQVLSPPHMRGRVMSIYLLNRGLVPVGSLLAGALASAFGAPRALLILACLSLAIIVIAVSTSPGFLRLKVSLNEDEGELRRTRATGRAT